MTVLGSGGLVAQLAADLNDEHQILLNPVVLGKGRSLFEGIPKRINLKLISSRGFWNGNLLLSYEPVRE
ncbi:MAG: dihydrofolate reductase family protein [Desulfobulbaceae bacterium]|nr:dihydrofolate reductase family protein [Desulfobulbaceae bacterium]